MPKPCLQYHANSQALTHCIHLLICESFPLTELRSSLSCHVVCFIAQKPMVTLDKLQVSIDSIIDVHAYEQ